MCVVVVGEGRGGEGGGGQEGRRCGRGEVFVNLSLSVCVFVCGCFSCIYVDMVNICGAQGRLVCTNCVTLLR